MNGPSTPVLLRYRRKHVPSASIAVAVLVALLILFLWMHLILAQEIGAAGREIQVKTEELKKVERHSHEIRRQISIAGSQQRMAERSEALGYEAQPPVYLLVDHPLPPSSKPSPLSGLGLAGAGSAEAAPGDPPGSLAAGSRNGE